MNSLNNWILCVIFIFVAANPVYGQQVIVTDFSERATDISGKIHSRTDLNGEKCALIKIIGNAKMLSSNGNVIGAIEQRGNESWMYVCGGTKQFVLNIEGANPIKINSNDFGITIQGGHTYSLEYQFIDEIETVRLTEIMLLFPAGINNINPAQKALIKNILQTFNEIYANNPSAYISIESYPNNFVGNELTNKRDSAIRANLVSKTLSEYGANMERLIVIRHSEVFFREEFVATDKSVIIIRLNNE